MNQGWKDSGDGVSFPDGRLPEPPIALVEVQGYVYGAKLRMAELFRQWARPAGARRCGGGGRRCGSRIREAFWMEKRGIFALALDGAKRQVPTITSNAGHLLWSRVPTPEQSRAGSCARCSAPISSRAGACARWARRSAVYNPMSYHNGSVWPHDNALLVLGIALHGRARAALPVVRGAVRGGVGIDFQRLPELFAGWTASAASGWCATR